ncbi:Myotubularin-like phosphatase domain [Balamuthia mandrillaris]
MAEKEILSRIEANDPSLALLRWQIYEDESVVSRIAKRIKNNTNLKQINLSGNITNASCSAVTQILELGKAVQHLNLSQSKIGVKGLEKIAKALETNTTLQCLTLSQTKHPQLNDVAIASIATALTINKTLNRLEFIAFNITNLGAKSLAGMLAHNSTLESLKLSANPFGNDGMKDIARSLKTNKGLRRLYLDRQVRGEANLNDKGILYVAHILKDFNSTLELLSFNQSVIDEKSLSALVDCSLSPTCNLRVLRLASSNLTDEHLLILARGLRQNCSLTSLDLSNNKITDDGVTHLRLRSNAFLRELNLSGNEKVGNKAMLELGRMLKYNHSLVRLLCNDCPVADKAKSGLSAYIELNFTIRHISFSAEDNGRGLSSEGNAFLERNTDKANKLANLHQSFKQKRMKGDSGLFSNTYQKALDLGGFHFCSDTSTLVKFIKKELRKKQGKGLTKLYLYSNRLPHFPQEVMLYGHELTVLDLSGNFLTSIPSSALSNMKSLEHLDLRFNRLSSIPPEIALLTNLRILLLDHNDLESLPKRIFALKKLTQLTLSQNPIEEKDLCLMSIYEQINHPALHLSGLKMFTLPEEFFLAVAESKTIDTINLSNNKLTSLPPEIGSLTSITSLDVSNNNLNGLPWQLGDLTNLKTLNLSGNPLVLIPDEVVTQEVSKLLGYVRALKDGKSKVYRMKLMFVGQENVGKTSLYNLLSTTAQDEEDMTEEEILLQNAVKKKNSIVPGAIARKAKIVVPGVGDKEALGNEFVDTVSTDGIDIHNLRFPAAAPEGKDVNVSCWDFAGQELYYSTHAFFLSKRSLFLVVFNMAEPIEVSKKKIDYWLASIHSKTKASPVLVVGTHRDAKKCTKEYVKEMFGALAGSYQDKYPGIKGYFAVSCRTKKGFKKLREALLSTVLEQKHMGEEIPSSFAMLEEQIKIARKAISPPILMMEDFKEMAIKCGVEDRSVASALQFMHDLGIIVKFTGNSYRTNLALENLIILDPTWLSSVFRSIVTTKHNCVSEGIIEHKNLIHIWKPPKYPTELHESLLAILEKCEVSYPLQKGLSSGRSLIATLLPDLKPVPEDLERAGWAASCLTKDKRDGTIMRVYGLDFLPHGLFSRFMVRTLQITSPKLYWKNGILVAHNSVGGNTLGLLEANEEEQQIYIQVRGTNPANLMTILDASLMNLVQSWFEVNCEAFAVCRCDHCGKGKKKLSERTLVPLSVCQKSAFQGEDSVPCPHTSSVPLDLLVPDLTLADLSDAFIQFDDIELGTQIGEGGAATVYKGEYKGQTVAVKELKMNTKKKLSEEKRELMKIQIFNEFRAEAWIMKTLQHPNIVRMIGLSKRPLALVTEYVPHGSLYDLLHRDDLDKILNWKMRMKLVIDIAKGVECMHAQTPQIIHRDLKTLNVLLTSIDPDEQVVCKVADFGTCVASTTFVGRVVDNPLWLAPEIMAGYEYSEKADIYSFAMIMYEVLTAKLPFDEYEIRFVAKLEKQIEEGLRPTIPVASTPPLYAQLMRDCWAGNPNDRPPMTEVVRRLKAMYSDIAELPYGWEDASLAVEAAAIEAENESKRREKEEQQGLASPQRDNRRALLRSTDLFTGNDMLGKSGSLVGADSPVVSALNRHSKDSPTVSPTSSFSDNPETKGWSTGRYMQQAMFSNGGLDSIDTRSHEKLPLPNDGSGDLSNKSKKGSKKLPRLDKGKEKEKTPKKEKTKKEKTKKEKTKKDKSKKKGKEEVVVNL